MLTPFELAKHLAADRGGHGLDEDEADALDADAAREIHAELHAGHWCDHFHTP